MRFLKYIIYSITFLISVSFVYATEPYLITNIIIPGLNSDIKEFEFNEVVDNLTPEILVTDGNILVLYSQSLDSVLFTDTIPTTSDTVINFKILFDDINRDSIPDLMYARYVVKDSMFTTPSMANCELYFYGGPNYSEPQFFSMDTLIGNIGGIPFGKLYELKALDLNRDGYNQFILSFETTDGYSNITSTALYTTGVTLLYESFPSSLTTIKDKLLSDFKLTNGSLVYNTVIANRYYSGESESLGNPYTTAVTNDVVFLDSNFVEFLSMDKIKDQVINCSGVVNKKTVNSLSCPYAGSIYRDTNDRLYLILKYNWRQSLTCYNSTMTEFDTSGSELMLYQYISDSLLEIWSTDVTGSNYHDFEILDLARNYFFGFLEDTLFQFWYYNLSPPFSQIENLPQGTYKWVYPFEHFQYVYITYLSITNGNHISLYSFDVTTDIDENMFNLPQSFTLSQNYPNPFNPSTTISFELPKNGNVKAEVYNILGQKVSILLDKTESAGSHTLTWDASAHSSGVYLIKMTFEDESKSIKTMLLK